MLSKSLSFNFILVLLGCPKTLKASASWVDPDTDLASLKTSALTLGDDRQYKLVFSDEFNKDGRTFTDGEDPRWTALEKNDYTNDALHYYRSENVKTENGVLNITTDFKDNSFVAIDLDTEEKFIETKKIQSGMVQSWNKFCFTGGVVEISAKLPGKPEIGGLWPALWLLGNLARATYVGSSDFVWPWSYNKCDDAVKDSQEINACAQMNHFGMLPHAGRGSPEIDILEAMGGPPGELPNTSIERPYISSSLQVSPGRTERRPLTGELPEEGYWYEGVEYGEETKSDLNVFFYGVKLEHKPKSYTYQSDTLSANMKLGKTHYENQHVYRLEWEPSDENGDGGYIRWYIDGVFNYGFEGNVLDFAGSQIPDEPMYILLNTAVSSNWGFPKPCPSWCDCKCYECGNPDCECGLPDGFCENIPANFEIDYVRVYQAENDEKHELGCSTPRKPTKTFIEGHKDRYMSEGDKEPLKAVLQGGAICETDDDCGSASRGYCAKEKQCVCIEGVTGPNCLASDAVYDNVIPTPEFKVETAQFPFSLYAILVVLFSGLAFALVFNVMKVRKQTDVFRKKLRNDSLFSNQGGDYGGGYSTYQSTANDQPTENSSNEWDEKVVSYCMIDNRLIEKK